MFTIVPIPAAPSPCTALPAIKTLRSFTKAQIRLPAKNMAFAIKRIGFRPQMSENFPQDGVLAVCAKTYEVPIQV